MLARLVVLFVFSGLVSCAMLGGGHASPADFLGEWTVTSIAGAPVVEDSPAFLGFGADGSVYGDTSVNRLSGSWSVDEFFSGPMASTRMAGPPELMMQEQRMLDSLNAVRDARLDGGELVLLTEGGDELMRLAPRE